MREDSEDDLSGLAERPFIVALGRLARVKGFDLLIEAFSRIVEIFPSVRLVILGEGPERESLEAQVMDKGLGRKVLLHGAMRDPFPVLRRAEFLVLSSRAEGFGNAVIEAMACAVPVVSFDCPSGPSEIIGHEVNGLLVEGENVAALAEAMIRVLGDKDLRDAMARKARESAEAFSLDRIASQWDILLREVTGRCSN